MLSPLITTLAILLMLPLAVRAERATEPDWRQMPIPRASVGTTTDYHNQPVNLKAALPDDRLEKLANYGLAGESFYARKDGFNAPYYRAIAGSGADLFARKTVAQRLKKVNDSLARYAVELFILDAWRSIECQTALWQYFVGVAKAKNPGGSAQSWNTEAAKYCSDPSKFDVSSPRTWTVHVTGGAVDLTLRRKGTGELLYMGGIFDDASSLSETAHFEKTAGNQSELDARRNRRLLYHAMVNAGFTNYPAEWWHFDYGDQMWSLLKNLKGEKVEAIYGPIN